ncbi:hypothetical protein [Paracoccus binzhouensis]|uniref:hypothetical protein n=1 Tax=Paracoccus binzhouensis TaxID=2796149 RepID=UPI0018EEE766|nr:hypothetical protein [Paracoccus binzhouensis]
MKFRSAFAVLSMTVALAACGELPFQKSAEPEAAGHVGPPGVSPLEQPIETGTEQKPVATAEASTMGTAMFRAAGSGWTVTAADKTAVFERPGAKSVGVTVRRMTYASGVEFIGNMNGQIFALNIRAQSCEIGDRKTPFTASLRVGSQRLAGCAVPTDTMPKAQTRASSAAPKPKTQPKPAAPAAKPAESKPTGTQPETAPTTQPGTVTTTTLPKAETAPTSTPATTGTPTTGAPTTQPPSTETPGSGSGSASTTGGTTATTPSATTPSGAEGNAADSGAAGGSDASTGTATGTTTGTASGAATTGTTGGVPAPELVLPPTPPAAETDSE